MSHKLCFLSLVDLLQSIKNKRHCSMMMALREIACGYLYHSQKLSQVFKKLVKSYKTSLACDRLTNLSLCKLVIYGVKV
ncbi:hypothetical protein B0681_04415 [Moraxella porci DSM 25326]|uniref:Uncharacterized protein n=1 Tax=Moraxella porci DSM 25326 TaxID=573983 RepID=A0A1T0CSC7_9GAMM|nr:hypothetical protein B0681_04415 [Moraxella porci DSM 25326]